LATSVSPIKIAKLQKIRTVVSNTTHSKKPLGITKLTIHKGGSMLDVLEQYENKDVKETISRG
jgi:hypothetical protein